MRVLHVHSGNLYGGVETMLLTQVRQRNLSPGMETSFALCFAGRFGDELLAAGAHVDWLGAVKLSRLLSVRRARRNFRELLRRRSVDVVVTHSSWSHSIFGPVARALSVPLVFYLHAQPRGGRWLERLARRTPPELILCNSRFTAAALTRLYAHVKSEIVYCPVAPPERCAEGLDAKAMRAATETPIDATVIIQVGRMEPLKGHLLHLEALSLLKDMPGWVCWQVGGGQRPEEHLYVERLKAHAARLGLADRVRFLGQRADVASLLAAADVYCQPNIAPDSFGISFIEALYARLPVVTTALGGACEIVDDTCGVLVPPGDVQALAYALRGLLQDGTLRSQKGLAGPARALQLCEPGARLKQFEAALNSVRAGVAS
jgi:glycosyltransferase involved in cell wall biosynthesis